jgi:hypothetical protein
MVDVSYSSQACTFVAEAGRRYWLRGSCWITEVGSDDGVGAVTSPTNLDAYMELVRAYAACGDLLGSSEFRQVRDSGRLSRPPEDWLLGKCDPIIDFR